MKMLACLALLCVWMGAAAAQPLEILTLRYRTAEQVLPQLRPLLEPGAALTGTGGKLFVRTSARNLADLRRVLDELDRAPRRLMISVRQGGERQEEARGAEVSGEVGLGGKVRVISSGRGDSRTGTMEIRRGDDAVRLGAFEARAGRAEHVDQRVQTVEGGSARIDIGRSVPLPVRQTVRTPGGSIVADTVVYRDVTTGFMVEPRLAGERVTLDIRPTLDTPGRFPGSADIQHLATTVSGRLGEWIELGGSLRETANAGAGALSYETRGGRDERGVWLKVEELP